MHYHLGENDLSLILIFKHSSNDHRVQVFSAKMRSQGPIALTNAILQSCTFGSMTNQHLSFSIF